MSKDPIRYKEYLDKRLSQARESFADGNNSPSVVKEVYEEFKDRRLDAATTQYSPRDIMRGVKSASHLSLSPATNYRDRGSHPSTIGEDSEKSSRKSSEQEE